MRLTIVAATLLLAAACSGEPYSFAAIINSGSTNAPGFRIDVTRSGAVTWHNDPARNIPNSLHCAGADGTGRIDASLAVRFLDDLRALGTTGSVAFPPCGHSVSFGSQTTVQDEDTQITNVECGVSADPRQMAVIQDVNEVQHAVSVVCQ